MRRPIIVINTQPRDYKRLIVLSSSVMEKMTSNSYFPSPSPSLVDLLAAKNEVVELIAKWGPVGNRGSKADLMDLRNKSLTLSLMLKSMAQYVQNTAQLTAGNNYSLMATIISTSGFELRRENTPQGMLQEIQNFRFLFARNLNRNQVKLKWAKPLDVSSYNNIKLYKIYKSTTELFQDAVMIASVAKTSFIDVNNSLDTVTWNYWIVPVGTVGDGVVSGMHTIKLLGR